MPVDNVTIFHGNGSTAIGQDAFQQLLGGEGNLTDGFHTITITNKGSTNGTGAIAYIDIDYMIWESSLPSNSDVQILTSRTPEFEYLPNTGGIWLPYSDPNGYDGVIYSTQSSEAEFRLNFTGQSVALYGYLDSNHGNFSCNIDGISQGLASGSYPNPLYQQLICFADSLDNNTHVLTVKNIPTSTTNNWLSIDYAEIRGSHPYVHPGPSFLHLFWD